MADCIASKLLTGRAPMVVQATTFAPSRQQEDLGQVCVAGNSDYAIDPNDGDFFKQTIDLRRSVKDAMRSASPQEKADLDRQQLALKILANATSYGIFVELNVENEKQLQSLLCYGPSGEPNPVSKKTFEAPGAFFHPLLAALITGAARLMLATTERLAVDAGLDWAFCDTDSMALAKPDAMGEATFFAKAQEVQEWFTPLNPYAENSPLLKIEDYNFLQSDMSTLQPLYCYAVSSKRYALFNLDEENQPVLRKVSAHGLGHLLPPYHRAGTNKLEGSLPWQQDFWLEIIVAEMEGRPPDFSSLPNFDRPGVSRYAATTPKLESWFRDYNAGKLYRDRVRPFNFLLALQARMNAQSLMPVAPFHRDPAKSLKHCFDRKSGARVRAGQLRTYQEALAQYYLHPEAKFLKADYADKGPTQRRHIMVKSIHHIGKEANKWEEQFFTGLDADAQIKYGISQKQRAELLDVVIDAISTYGTRSMADASGLSRRHVSYIYNGKSMPSESALGKLILAAQQLGALDREEEKMRGEIRTAIQDNGLSMRALASYLEMDPSNLSRLISGKRGRLPHLDEVVAALPKLLIQS